MSCVGLQTALSMVESVEEQIQSSVSLWQLLPRQLVRNREVQLADGMYFNFSSINTKSILLLFSI